MRSLHYPEIVKLLEEIKILEGGIIDKIYYERTNTFCFKIYKKGNYFLRYILGKAIYVDKDKFESADHSSIRILREILEREKIEKIDVIRGERVIFIETKNYRVYFELFSQGNIIITNKNDVITNALIKKDFGWRKIFPKEKYVVTKESFDPFNISYEEFKERIKSSKRKDIVRTLAIDFKLGGLYAEELIFRSKIDKSKRPSELNEDEIKNLYDNYIRLLNEKQPCLYSKEFSYTRLYHIAEEPSIYTNFNDVLKEYYNKYLNINPEEEKIKNMIQIAEEELKKTEEEIKDLEKIGEFLKDYGWLLEEVRKMILSGKTEEEINQYIKELGFDFKVKISKNKLIILI